MFYLLCSKGVQNLFQARVTTVESMATGQKTAETTGIGYPIVVEDTTDPIQLEDQDQEVTSMVHPSEDVSILDNLAEVKPYLRNVRI